LAWFLLIVRIFNNVAFVFGFCPVIFVMLQFVTFGFNCTYNLAWYLLRAQGLLYISLFLGAGRAGKIIFLFLKINVRTFCPGGIYICRGLASS
jgi:hypothetical protein